MMKQNGKTIAIVAVSFFLLFAIVGSLLAYMSSIAAQTDTETATSESAIARLFGGFRGTRSKPEGENVVADGASADAIMAEDADAAVNGEFVVPQAGEGLADSAAAGTTNGGTVGNAVAEAPAAADSAGVAADGTVEEVGNQPRQINAPYTIYKNTLTKGWENRSWDTNVNFSGFPAYDGLTAIVVHFAAPDGAVYLYTPEPIKASDYNVLRFWINGGTAGGQQIEIALIDENENVLPAIPLTPPYPNNWRQVDILIEDLGSPASIHGIVVRETLGEAQPVFFIDEMSFVDDPLAGQFEETQINGPALTVFTQDERHEISRYIYGMNFAPESLARELRLPVNRWGGNAVTRYNYLEDSTNTANNWYYQNIPPRDPSPTLPRGSSADEFVHTNNRTETETLFTVPMIGYVARGDYECSFSVEKYGEQIETDEEWRPDCGAGVLMNGDEIPEADPNDTSIEVDSDWMKGWFRHLINEFGTADEGGVMFWNLDNEPMIWSHTHRDIHPQPLDTDTFMDISIDYASAVKDVDPSAQVAGPVFWGWSSYWWSDVDVADDNDPKVNAPDRDAHGGLPLAAYYLQQMKAHEDATGERILDYFDLHFYPQAGGVAFSEVGGESIQALRMRTTRALWDPAYVDESWIGEPVNLIPRMWEWVNTYYPGTKLAITEYNWGGLEHINGAIAQADVLGIFGRENLHLANLWGPPERDMPGAYAFRMFLNYDGRGSQFGDISIHAESENSDQMAIFAAKRREDGAMTVMVLNKSNIPMTSELFMRGMSDATAAGFRYGQANLKAIERIPPTQMEDGVIVETYPPYSITLFVFPGSGSSIEAETAVPTPAPAESNESTDG